MGGQPDGERRAVARRALDGQAALVRLDERVGDEQSQADAFARLETHFFVNAGWLEEGQLLRDAHKLKDIPGVIVHGRYDMPCPAKNAWALHKARYDAETFWYRGNGSRIPRSGQRRKSPDSWRGSSRSKIRFNTAG